MSEDPFAPVDGREIFSADFVGVRRKKPDEGLDLNSQLVGARQIARGNYVMARVSLASGYSIAGCLLAHQSIEEYLKGLIRASGGQASKSHDLRQLVYAGAYEFKLADLVTMLKNKDQMNMLDGLCLVYDTLRFSEEAGYIVANKNVLLFVDEVVFILEKTFAEKLGEPTPPRMFVHETVKERFLRHNDYWTKESVTNNQGAPGATNPAEGTEIAPEDAKKSITLVTMWAVGPLSGNIRIGSRTMKVSKEDKARADAQKGSEASTSSG
jgi:hypothetical protein